MLSSSVACTLLRTSCTMVEVVKDSMNKNNYFSDTVGCCQMPTMHQLRRLGQRFYREASAVCTAF